MNKNRFKVLGSIALLLALIVTFTACNDDINEDDFTVESIGTLESLYVNHGTEGSDVLEEIREERKEVDVKLSNNTSATADIAWDTVPDDFDGTAAGETFDFEGNITYDDTVFDKTVTVEVKPKVASNDIDSYALEILKEESNLLRVTKNPDAAFYWDYFLYIPHTFSALKQQDYTNYLLVEPNNTGKTSDDYEINIESAKQTADDNYIANELGIPLLVPTFPRPGTLEEAELEGWEYYTHSLDRNTLQLDIKEYNRIDKQLLAMIDHAQEILNESNIDVKKQVFMMGYSASGVFTNRFTALHPDRVEAIAAGGINGLPILPYERIDDLDLIYPVGVYDLLELTGVGFDLEAYRNVPQFLYIGDMDANDTLPYGDAYAQPERELTIELLNTEPVREDIPENAMILVERFEKAETYYNELDIPAQFKLYENTGHQLTEEKLDDIIDFFKNNAGNQLNEI